MKPLLLLPLACLTLKTQADEPPSTEYKLALGQYRYSVGSSGQDVNLRLRRDDTNASVAAYRDSGFGRQVRTGFDTSITVA